MKRWRADECAEEGEQKKALKEFVESENGKLYKKTLQLAIEVAPEKISAFLR